MINTDMMILSNVDVTPAPASPALHDSYSTEHAPPKDDVGLGGTCAYSFTNSQTSNANGKMTATFTRLLSTGDTACDKILTVDTPFSIIFAYNNVNTTFVQHNHYGWGTLQIGATQASSYFHTSLPAEFCPSVQCSSGKNTPPDNYCALYVAGANQNQPTWYTKACPKSDSS